MGLGFVKRLFGGTERAGISDDPFGSKALPAAVSSQAELPRGESSIVVQRDEIIDGRSRIAGYRFIARHAGTTSRPAAEQAVTALRNDNVPAFSERRLALIPVTPRDWLDAGFARLVGPNVLFVLNTPARSAPGDWQKTMLAIKAAGGRIAVDGGSLHYPGITPDMTLLEFSAYSPEGFERIVQEARGRYPGLPVAADGIGSWAEHRLCQSLGVTYSLGGFAAGPDEDARGDRLNESRLTLLEMLNLLRRDASPSEIADVAKRDPGIAVKIVGMANSPMSGLATPVVSLDQAMMALGRNMLYRWLSLAMYRAGSDSGRDESLLELTLFRARFLELMATGSRPKQECDELFLVGLLSLVDSLLGLPMVDIVAKMNLPEAVANVLLRSEGSHGRFLMMAMAIEKGRPDRAQELADALNLNIDKIEDCVSAARAWAEEALGAS